jgi:hypothetical protein
MSDTSENQLTVEDVNAGIRQAQAGGGDPAALVLQIFSGLGPSVSVSGDVLREAFKESAIAIGEPFSSILAGIDQIIKEQNTLTITRPEQTEFSVSGTRLRIQPELRFNVGTVDGRAVITSISGLSAHKILWFAIQSLEWLTAEGQKILRVGTSAGTRDIPIP